MPYGNPRHVEPWTRANWPVLNKGNKLYAISEWQCWLIRNGRYIPDIPQAVCNEIDKEPRWMSRKASNLFQHVFIDHEEQVEANQQDGRHTPPGSPGPPTLHSPGTGPRNLRSTQPPTLERERSEEEEEEADRPQTPETHRPQTVSDSESEEEFRGFESELERAINELKYRQHDICLHKCSHKIHIIISNND